MKQDPIRSSKRQPVNLSQVSMARFDVNRPADGEYLLDCQADLPQHLSSRLVVPLRLPGQFVRVGTCLDPTVIVDGQDMMAMTHFASAVPVRLK